MANQHRKHSFSHVHVQDAFANNVIAKMGATTEANSGRVYFISQIYGTALTLKDANGATLLSSVAATIFYLPLRVDYGFDLSGTNPGIVYAFIDVIPNSG